MHGDLARIELLPEELPRLMEENRYQQVQKKLTELGFLYVTLDLNGFQSGSMNKGLNTHE